MMNTNDPAEYQKSLIDQALYERKTVNDGGWKARNPQQAKRDTGATHYAVKKDGVTPQLYYKYKPETNTLSYYSFCGLWQGSNLNGEGQKFDDLMASLIEIKD